MTAEERAYITHRVEELKVEAEKLGYKLVKYQPYERLLPCICGCKARRTWYIHNNNIEDNIKFECSRCGRYVTGKNKKEAKINWNKMIREKTNGN